MTAHRFRIAQGLWGSSHPGPTLVVTALAGALSLTAGLDLWRVVLLIFAVFVGQLSVGFSNDAADAGRDRLSGREDKPVAAGQITVTMAWVAACTAVVAALVVSAPLGARFLAAHAVFLVCAWAYNLGVKSGPFSIVPFILGFGLFPSLVPLAGEAPQFAQAWVWCVGAVLGAAVHLTNVLPDLHDDAQTGVRGLPHRMGPRISAGLAAVALLAGSVVLTLGSAAVLAEVGVISWLFLVVLTGMAVLILYLALAGHSGRVLFRIVMVAALLLALQLVASGGSLT